MKLLTEVCAASIIIIGLVALAFASSEWFPVVPLIVAAGLRPFLPGRAYAPDLRVYGVFSVPCVVLAIASPVEGPSGLGLNVPFHIALFLAAAATLRLWTPDDVQRLPQVFFGATSALAAAGADAPPSRYGWLVVAFALPSLVVARAALPLRRLERPRARFIGVTIAFAFACALAFGLGKFVEAIWEDVSRVFMKGLQSAPISEASGFSGQAKLGNMIALQTDGGRSIALRVFATMPPGYLRGRVFTTYEDGAWKAAASRVEKHLAVGPRGMPRLDFAGRRSGSGEPDLSVHPSSRYAAHFFLPLGIASLEPPGDDLTLLAPGGAVEARGRSSTAGYEVWRDPSPLLGERDDFTTLPRDPEVIAALDRAIERLGLGAHPTKDEACRALDLYFASRYRYKIGVVFRPGADPIVRFLDELDQGHCELFATSGVLLLRRVGIPARYVTGFVCLERIGPDLWVARAKHGHAWAEAWDPRDGWTTAEFTPANGVPSADPVELLESWLERLRGGWERFAGAFLRSGFLAAVATALADGKSWLVGAWWHAVLPIAPFLIWAARRLARRQRTPRATRRSLAPDLEREREKLHALERSLARAGLARAESETLHEWASRIDASTRPDRASASAFVRGYAERRYARAT